MGGTPVGFVEDAPSTPVGFEPDPAPAQTQIPTPEQQPTTIGSRAKDMLAGGVSYAREFFGSKALRDFESNVVSGMGFDSAKIAAAGGDREQWEEVGRQIYSGLKDFGTSVAKDPFNITKPAEAMATNLEQGGKDIVQGKGPGRLIGATSTVVGGMKAPEKAAAVPLLDSATSMLDASKNKAIADLTASTANVGKRIGGLVKDISDADVAESAGRGKVGTISLIDAHEALLKAQDQYAPIGAKMGKVAQLAKLFDDNGGNSTLSWEHIKDFRTEVGQLMQGASGREKAILSSVYGTLTDQMEARAGALGKVDQFSAYNQLAKTMFKYEDGVLGKLRNVDTGLQFFDQIKKPSLSTELENLNQDLGKFGLADNFFKDLAKSHKETYGLVKRAETGSGGFSGKFASIGRRPVAAGGAYLATALSPMPGKFLLGLLAASKAAHIADKMAAASEMKKLGGAPVPQGNFGAAADVVPK